MPLLAFHCHVRTFLERKSGTSRRYALHVPDNLPLDAAAPLLCAGITVYSPLMHYGLNKPGMKLGVVGLGGLGHMAVKFGKVCMGCTCDFEATTVLWEVRDASGW